MNKSRTKGRSNPYAKALTDPRYKARTSEHIKVKERQVEDKEADEAIKDYLNRSVRGLPD